MPVTRREFLATAGLSAGALAVGAAPSNFQSARVDAAALRTRIETLSLHGRKTGGTFADGVSRVAYSDADVAGRKYVIDLIRAAGLEPRIDPAGNIFAKRAGTEPSLPPILFGSHIDSVPSGGTSMATSALAALGAIEAPDAGVRTRHHLRSSSGPPKRASFGRGRRQPHRAGDEACRHGRGLERMTRGECVRKIGGNRIAS